MKVNQYLAADKQPKEIETTKIYVEDLTRVANHPAMTHAFLDQLNQKVRRAFHLVTYISIYRVFLETDIF